MLGAVADIALSGFETGLSAPLLGLDYSSKLDYLGTIRARTGFLPTDNLLIYGHAGLAYGRFSPVVSSVLIAIPEVDSTNRIGWTIGAGLEYAVTENISVQTEYAFTNFGTATATNSGAPPVAANETLKLHTVKAGLNFRF